MECNNQTWKCDEIRSLFLGQAYRDAWDDYNRSVQDSNYTKWDYVILTASNEGQAETYRMQIKMRRRRGFLPDETKYVVLADPEGKRVGSGGATFHAIKYLAEQFGMREGMFAGRRILVIHSGGDSKRIPQYSAVGKLFSPVPRRLPDGRGSTLFDEFLIGMAGIPSRIKEGLLVLSGDVLLLFNTLQVDALLEGAAAISIKESVSTGKNHGVFLNDGNGNVKQFLHKQEEKTLRELGAVGANDTVDIDTGAVLLGMDVVDALYQLISTNYKVDISKYEAFVNENSCVSFYGDFLYPLSSGGTKEQYFKEKPENNLTPELRRCREQLWEALSAFTLKLICTAPSKFIHFGTTLELLRLMAWDVADYDYLGWEKTIHCEVPADMELPAAYQTYIEEGVRIAEGAYLENCCCGAGSEVGAGSVLSHVKLQGEKVPENVVLHTLPLTGDKYVTRIYGVNDDPKTLFGEKASFLISDLKTLIRKWKISENDLWYRGQAVNLWNARLYPVCDSEKEALEWALKLYHLVNIAVTGEKSHVLLRQNQRVNVVRMDNEMDIERAENKELLRQWLSMPRTSLAESCQRADQQKIMAQTEDLLSRILCREFIHPLEQGRCWQDAVGVLGRRGITEEIYRILLDTAKNCDFHLKIRIYYAVSRYLKENNLSRENKDYTYTEQLCFDEIKSVVLEQALIGRPDGKNFKISKDQVKVALPVRVNWGGGWTDTPPYCMEQGGTVLNAAIRVNGILPVQVTVRKLDEYIILLESQDAGAQKEFASTQELRICSDPYDLFAIHKAALMACGVFPLPEMEETEGLEKVLKRLGGGISLSTRVEGIPKGSGLGTSSILSAACVKALAEFFGQEKTEDEIYQIVLGMEQMMSTGGGWQDQAGGLTGGIKLISTRPGLCQEIEVKKVRVPEKAMEELQQRFVLIYTGQRRLARNLLRDVEGSYIGAVPSSLEALREMKPAAALMAYFLENGEIDEFARLLAKQWELSKKLDKGSTNGCIDQIFLAIDDLIDAGFVSGAGGGGFVMAVMKQNVTRDMLRKRLDEIFQDSGVRIWDCDFVLDEVAK